MLKENKIIKAIQKINPTAEVSVAEEDINSIISRVYRHIIIYLIV